MSYFQKWFNKRFPYWTGVSVVRGKDFNHLMQEAFQAGITHAVASLDNAIIDARENAQKASSDASDIKVNWYSDKG